MALSKFFSTYEFQRGEKQCLFQLSCVLPATERAHPSGWWKRRVMEMTRLVGDQGILATHALDLECRAEFQSQKWDCAWARMLHIEN